MAGGEATAVAGDSTTTTTITITAIQSLLRLVQDVVRISAAGFGGPFKKDCTDLSRRIAVLSHLLEEFRDFKGDLRPLDEFASSSSSSSCLSDLTVVVQGTKRLLFVAGSFDPKISSVSFVPFVYICIIELVNG